MPKLYSFLTDNPASCPRPNMTLRDMIAFWRDHDDQSAFEMTIMKGVHAGKSIRVTKRTLPTLQARYPVLAGITWESFVADQIARGERAFAEGRADPNKIINPVEG